MAQDRMNMTVPGRKYRRKKRITRTPPSLKVAKLQSQVRKISKTLKQNVEVKIMIVRFRTQQLTGMVYLPLQFLHQPLEILDRLEREPRSVLPEARYDIVSALAQLQRPVFEYYS